MERLDCLSGIEGKNGKTDWTRVGSAWPSKNGVGYPLYLDFLPMHRSKGGKLMLVLSPPREKGDAPPRDTGRQQSQSSSADLNDDIPF